MKTSYLHLAGMCVALFWFQNADAQQTTQTNGHHQWWQEQPYGAPFDSSKLKQLPLIRVQGNKFVDPDGKTILFRGVSIADPDKIEHEGHWNKPLFEEVKNMGATLVRIPVHPIAWRERTPLEYLKLLDQAVTWCTELGLYVDIDWHSIGNLQMEMFQDPMYDTTKKETFAFWRTIAQHFAGNNTVAFYELFNEPTLYRGQLGGMSWSDWKKLNEEMIGVIRAFDTNTIPLVAGLDWAYDLTPLNIEPINAADIGYVTHPYPWKRTPPWPPKWEEDFGFAAANYPIIATEIGFTVPQGTVLTTNDYGPQIVNYLENRGISWVAWCFDPDWGPTLLENWNFDLTPAGKFFEQAMHGKVVGEPARK
ncbi:MAG TPA: cellulase family glycosylhydrolase [Candidatus Saccharimonadales bacterium]|nr:cellulase family glycosylhydrolase [Candidatus Saccharimonadales bacterium]